MGGISSVIKGYLSTELPKRHNIILIASHKDGTKFIKLIQAITGLIKTFFYLITKKIDIVHIHTGDIVSCKRKYIYFKLVRLFNPKIIFHFHGASFLDQYLDAPKILQERIKYLFEETDLVICLSNSWKDSILSIAPRSTVRVLPNAVTIPEVSYPNKEKRDGLQISFLGLIGERKGVFDLLKVIRKFIDKKYNISLNIGGNGEIERLNFMINNLGLSEYVKYLGWINEKEKDTLLRKTDIFVLPSYGEGLPMSILEAMSYSIPVVSTPVGGIPELISDGETGFLIEPGDIDALYTKLKQLIVDDKLRLMLGEKGREVIAQKHNIKKISKQIDQIYLSI